MLRLGAILALLFSISCADAFRAAASLPGLHHRLPSAPGGTHHRLPFAACSSLRVVLLGGLGRVMRATARCVEPDDRAHLHPASRRQALHLAGAALALALTSTWVGGPAAAFDNAVPEYSKYATKPKRRGDAPKDIGVLQRTVNADSLDTDPRSFRDQIV